MVLVPRWALRFHEGCCPVLLDRWLDRAAARHGLACLFLVIVTVAAALPGFATLFPMDRDEPRFAQASKQMLETGDLVTIRFHDEARNKKPVGIYWLQAAAVATGEALGVPDARLRIWLYRVPSLLGAIAAVLLTYWTALALASRRAAVVAGVMMATALLLIVEAHLAKTDAVLLATVVASMGVLARAFVARARREPLSWPLAGLFWTAVAVGILVKGPITPMVPLFAGIALSVRERSIRWLGALRPVPGLVWCLVLVLPWFVLILKATGGAFLAESVGHDMAGKVAGAQESHGAPFGTYLAAFWVTAWPFAPFALLAAPVVWRDRRSDQVAFLLAWAIPTWLLFETVPTKLPHYVLPTYPALAILAASSLLKGTGSAAPRGLRLWLFGAALALVPALLPVALALAPGHLTTTLGWPSIALGVLTGVAMAVAVGVAIVSARRAAWGGAVAGATFAAVALYIFVLGWMMNATNADRLALSPRLADAGRDATRATCPRTAFATVGDDEPSLVFETGTDLLMTDAAGAARFLQDDTCRVAFVASGAEPAFDALLGGDPRVALVTRVVGTNINGGKTLDIGVYVRQGQPS